MRKLLLLLLISQYSFALYKPLRDIETKLKKGDVHALYELVPFFERKDSVEGFDKLTYFGIMHGKEKVGDLVREIIRMNTVLQLDTIITKKQYTALLKQYAAQLIFEPATSFFYLPFENDADHQLVFTKVFTHNILSKRWLGSYLDDDSLWIKKDPRLLFTTAIRLYRNDDRFDWEALSQLIHLNIDIQKKQISLVNYFQQHYSSFTWDSTAEYFTNPDIIPKTR